MKATRVFYEGRVQGVGFRWTVRDLAKGYDVSGNVRNLDDGRVELRVCGEDMSAFLEAIRSSALAGHIHKEVVEQIELSAPLRGFAIA